MKAVWKYLVLAGLKYLRSRIRMSESQDDLWERVVRLVELA